MSSTCCTLYTLTSASHTSLSLPAAAETTCSQAVPRYLQALAGAQLAAGQRVLIHAGSGGVGSMAIQIAKLWGAHVVTTCSAGKFSFVQVPGISHQCSLDVAPVCTLLFCEIWPHACKVYVACLLYCKGHVTALVTQNPPLLHASCMDCVCTALSLLSGL